MTSAVHQLPSERLARRFFSGTTDCASSSTEKPEGTARREHGVTATDRTPRADAQFFQPLEKPVEKVPSIGSFHRGSDGLALVEHVSQVGLVDFYLGGVVDTLPAAEFFKRFPSEDRI